MQMLLPRAGDRAMTRHAAVLSDPELIELLGAHPELLAIADAIAATAQVRRRRIPLRLLVASVTLVAAAAGGARWALEQFAGAGF